VPQPGSSRLTRALQWLSKGAVETAAVRVPSSLLWRRCLAARALEEEMPRVREEASKLQARLADSNYTRTRTLTPTLTLTLTVSVSVSITLSTNTHANPSPGQACEQKHEKVLTDYHAALSVLQLDRDRDKEQEKYLRIARENKRKAQKEAEARLAKG